MNILYNIFAVTGFLWWLVVLIIALVMLYCWLADMVFYYSGRTNDYEPIEHQPPSVDLSIHGSMPLPIGKLESSFHGGRYK